MIDRIWLCSVDDRRPKDVKKSRAMLMLAIVQSCAVA